MKNYRKRRYHNRLYKAGLTLAVLVPAVVVLLVGLVLIGVNANSDVVASIQPTPPVEQFVSAEDAAEQLLNSHAQCSLDTMYYLSDVVKRHDLFYPHINAVALYIDDQMLLAVKDEKTADDIIARLKLCPESTNRVLSVELEQDVSYKREQISAARFDGYYDLETAVAYINNGGLEVITYTIAKGDTLSEIAYQNNSTVERLIADNPYLENKKYLTIGDQLIINRPEPLVTQFVTVIETRVEELEPDREYIDNESLYVGEQLLIENGEAGEKILTEEVVYRNGIVVERSVQAEEILADATSDIYEKGVRPLPAQLAQSTLVRPVTAYRITSRFGPREHLGYHYGIDLKMPYGSMVHASEGGVVKTAGYRGSYGNLVVIDHGNGLQTYYAHNSKILVSVGQYVEKGQDICLSGNSGNSTGPHLHFEIKLNNVSVNPEKYLPF